VSAPLPEGLLRHHAHTRRIAAADPDPGDHRRGARRHQSHKYLGTPYPNFTGRPETRVIVTIEADRVLPPARR
jgi:hypothetical protein